MNVTRHVLWATFTQRQLKCTSKNIRFIKYYSNCLNNEFVKSTKYNCNVTSQMLSLNFYKCTVPNVKRYCSAAATEERREDTYRSENNITVIGDNIPKPYIDIEHTEFPDYIKKYLQKKAFDKPTVIQAQGWPIALSGQNFVGIAQTGTGKTLAYLLPAIVHIKEKESRKGLGPIALILAPTRELARQIEQVAQEFRHSLNIRCVCVYGGASRLVQAEKLDRGVDIVIATPGRLNDFLTSKVTNLARCTYVVLDEADRMLDMGFEPQIRQALEGVPEERQILMFSATWPNEVKSLARDYLGRFVQVNVGSTELTANHNITQHFYVCEQHDKMEKFQSIISELSEEGIGKVLVFANTKKFVDTLTFTLQRNGFKAAGIHGDKSQAQRDIIIHKFKTGKCNILVATEVAARGLDVDGVTHVVNYDFPMTVEDYVHRIGRTGRSENKGASFTMMTQDDDRHAKSLVALLQEANQEVPNELVLMARSSHISKSLERTRKQQNRKFVYGGGPKRFNKFRRNNNYDY